MNTAALLSPPDAARQAAFDQGAAAGPSPFDPSEEYRRILEAAEPRRTSQARRRQDSASVAKPDAYQHLMSKERRVLDTVDRVVNDVARKESAEKTLLGMPLHELAMRTVGACRALLDDLVVVRSPEEAWRALSDPGRVPYLGIALIALSLLLAALTATG